MKSYDASKDLLDAFRASPDTFRIMLEGITPEAAREARGGDENWSVVEVLCHQRDVEERALERMRAIRDQESPFLPSYDQDAWAIERDYAGQDHQQALSGFLDFRARHIAELEALTPEQWKRSGIHEEQGQLTITDQTLHLVAHDTIHIAQIARQLKDSGR